MIFWNRQNNGDSGNIGGCQRRRERAVKTIFMILKWSLFVVHLLSHVQLVTTPWTPACKASQLFTISLNLLKLMSIELMMPSNHLILWCPFSSCPQFFLVSGSFLMSWLFTSGGQNIEASASASVLSVNIQVGFPLGLDGLISFLSKRLSRVFSNTRVRKHQFFSTQPSFWSNSHIHTWPLEKP